MVLVILHFSFYNTALLCLKCLLRFESTVNDGFVASLMYSIEVNIFTDVVFPYVDAVAGSSYLVTFRYFIYWLDRLPYRLDSRRMDYRFLHPGRSSYGCLPFPFGGNMDDPALYLQDGEVSFPVFLDALHLSLVFPWVLLQLVLL